MISYEIAYIINPTLEEEAIGAIVDRFSNIISSGNGEIVKIDKVGKKKLAYDIKGHKEGYYVLTQIRAPKETAREVARQMKIAEEVLRSLLIKTN